MPFRWNPHEHLLLGRYVLKWLTYAAPLGGAVGSACALFLWSLDKATNLRFAHPWLLFLLPISGIAVVFLYSRFGGRAEGGNNLIMDAIHAPQEGDSAILVPRRMAPLILISTLITHLFGGSAGREGTAVQMGGSIASTLGRMLRLGHEETKILLMAGIAAGFGGIFGTPMAGAVFAMEVLAVGRISYEALIPCITASLVADWACSAWGIHHTHYAIASIVPHFSWLLIAKILPASIAFGLASVLFAELTHSIGAWMKARFSNAYLRPVLGGVLIIGLTYVLGTRDYLGIGVVPQFADGIGITTCFQQGGADTWSWWWKILFTAITLGSGFKGGEVTPLFFMGAALGNTLGGVLHVPVDLMAALGFVAIFAGATNTPLACTLMGIELFGADYSLYIMLACFTAYIFSGYSGIYLSQHIATPKSGGAMDVETATLRKVRELRPGWRFFRGKK